MRKITLTEEQYKLLMDGLNIAYGYYLSEGNNPAKSLEFGRLERAIESQDKTIAL